MQVQKIIAVGVTVHEYLARPQQIQREEHLGCPICPEGHRLWRHGWYRRRVILPGGEVVEIPVARLLCRNTGTTVSLLPDFCIPRRQHGPAVLGLFLEALVVCGLSLAGAMRRARPDAPRGHSLPQSLLAGFRRRLSSTRTWLGSQRARAPTPQTSPSRRPLEVCLAVTEILGLAADSEQAFIHAGRGIHDLTGMALA